MRAVVQRVSEARVEVDGQVVGRIGRGVLVLLGVEKNDNEQNAAWMAEKICNLRLFPDNQGRLNLNVREIEGSVLSISQFTLVSHIKKGNRPDFTNAMPPEQAAEIYDCFNRLVERICPLQTGVFRANMQVALVNDGPVTLILEK